MSNLMSSQKTIADRLLEEARKKTAKSENPLLGKVALIVGVTAVLVSPVSLLGWIVGAVAIGIGVAAAHRPVSVTQARIAIALGAAAILIGVFFFTLNVALG
jgi:ABC-type enterochelin transport system permease subunit